MLEAVPAQWHKGVTEKRRLWVPSPLAGMNYYFLIISFLRSCTKAKSPALSSGAQHAVLRKVRRKVGNEVSSLPTLIGTGYSVNLI